MGTPMLDETIFHGRRLAIVGSICRDVKMGVLRPGAHLLEDGETPTAFISETIGGGGANSALAAAALSAEVRFCGGSARTARPAAAAIAGWPRRGHLHSPRSAVATGSSVVLSYENGCRHFISCQPNNYGLAMADVDLAMPRVPNICCGPTFGSPNRCSPGATPSCSRPPGPKGWPRRWTSTGIPIGAPPRRHGRRAKEAVRRILPLVDLVHGNVRELNQFADSADLPTTLRQITAWGAAAIVIHMGRDGAGYYHRGQLTVSPAVPVRQYQNTAGTGDLLSVCMMLLHGQIAIPSGERLRLANTIVAEFIEGRRGVIPALE